MTYTIPVCTVKTPDDGHRNCSKHVEFYSKNKFEKLVLLVGFIIRMYHDARSPDYQIISVSFCFNCFSIYVVCVIYAEKTTKQSL